MRRVAAVVGILVGTVVFAAPAEAGGGGCHSAERAPGSGTTVEMRMFCMTPRVLRADSGTVTFVNHDEVTHNLYGDGWSFNEVAPGKSVTHEFAAGTHPYACTLHPGMVGAVVVGASATRAAATRASSDGGAAGWVFGGLGGVLVGAGAATVRRRVRGSSVAA
jgi:plastocyanin